MYTEMKCYLERQSKEKKSPGVLNKGSGIPFVG